ncbi:MAG: nitroreductase family protein, partial [Gemmatimonadota bacterium]
MTKRDQSRIVALPAPRVDSAYSLERSLAERRSVREYSDESISLADVSQLLWAAHGMTHAGRGRTVPSAGALYPLEVFLVAGAVDGLEVGLYRHRNATHELE